MYDDSAAEQETLRPSIRSTGRVASSSRLSVQPEYPESPVSPIRPNMGRSQTFQGPTSIQRETTPVNGRQGSVPNDPGVLRNQLRPTNRTYTGNDVFGDPSDESTMNSGSPDRSWGERSISPATSHGSVTSRSASYTTLPSATNGRKGPPPAPPARSKKPPPPPPMKRAEFSSNSVSRY